MHKRNGVRGGILGLIVAAAISPGVAVAADLTVTTTADGADKECVDDCTLREAVVLAGSADRVLVPSGNYVLTAGELSLNNDTIIGEDARKTFIDGGHKSRVLRVIEVPSRVSNVTIRNGNGVGLDPDGVGGGIFIHSGALILLNSTVSGNTGTMGGGIAANGIAALSGVTVSGNTASTGRLTRGGGIAADTSGGLILSNSTVSGNTAVDEDGAASQGGGVYSSGALAIAASTIANNSAAQGGGLYAVAPETGTFSLQSSLISHGTGGACGGSGIDNLTAAANVISDASCQFKDPSNLQSVNPEIGALADNGGPTNTHALLPVSPAIGHAGSCATQDQRLITRVEPCDSGAYEYRAPRLRVVMQVINDSGGTRAPDQFDVHVTSGGRDVPGSPRDGSEKGITYTLDAGAYSVAADSVAGYALSVSGDCAADGSITLQEGQDRSCTITANDIAPTLRVVTNVVNDQGGTLGPANFTAHVRRGGIDVVTSPQPGSAAGTVYTLLAGAPYAVAADTVAGYALAVSGGCAAITLQLAQNATCTITATDNPPTLRVITNVINDHGGTLAASNFSVHVRAGSTDVNGSPQPGTATGTAYTLSAGMTYTVAADPVSGYALTISGDCAENGTITIHVGPDRTCTITANDDPPPPTVQPAVSAQELPPPEAGKNVNALPKSGKVKVKLPGTAAYVDLDEAQQLPVGTVVDARKGHVTLVAASNDSGGTATAEFWAGIFKLGQTKGRTPTTVLRLVEKLSCPKAGRATLAAKRKKKRRLWGDGSGKFQTRGKHSAATVVGTKWLVEDRCTSTLTRVARGRVSVRDFAKKKTVIVRAGKKYVARAKKR